MLLEDATLILARLTDAFPSISLEEGQAEVLVKHVALLHDPSVLDEAVTNLINREDRFPSIAGIRTAYRSVNDDRAMKRAALEAAAPVEGRGIPVWVHVWNWHRRQTMEARKQANTASKAKMEDRPPVRMRMFPQETKAARDADLTREWREMSGSTAPGSIVSSTPPDPEEANAYTFEEYDEIRQEWVVAGAPEFGAAEILQVIA